MNCLEIHVYFLHPNGIKQFGGISTLHFISSSCWFPFQTRPTIHNLDQFGKTRHVNQRSTQSYEVFKQTDC